jgi:hypothetical protein
MRSLEDELREAYRAVTGMVRERDLPGLYEQRARRRRSRFSAFAPLAAAAAVVVAVGFGLVVRDLLSGPGRPAAPRTTAPFMIVVNTPNARRPLVVVSAATGRTTATVAVPRKGTVWFDVAPTASGTRFIVAATPLRGGLCNPTYLYTLTLSASGVPASLRPWTVPVVHAEIGSLSASADGGTLAFAACRGPDQQIGIIRGGRMKTWREPYPLFADDLSLSAGGSKLGYAESAVAGRGARVRVLDTGSAPGSATAASTIVYTYPAAGRAPSAAIGPDFTTMYVSWLTGRDTFHLAGYRIGVGGVQGPLFSRTMPGEMVSLAGGQVLVWDPGVSLYLADPVTGKATRIRTAWTNAWGIFWYDRDHPHPDETRNDRCLRR